eukprot:735153_1
MSQLCKGNITHKTANMIYSLKEDQKPTYFMQVTSVDEDVFHMNVVADVVADSTRKLFIKDMNSEKKRIIRIKKGKISAGIDMEIHESESYQFVMHSGVESVEPIANATQLKLTVLKDEKDMPPNNTEYKPKCIDSAGVFQVKDDENN